MSESLSVVIVTGLSGSGKSTAIRVLEDIGFYCIDNLPVVLIPNFLELCRLSPEISRVALGVDLREREFLRDSPRILDRLFEQSLPVEVLFLDASDEALIRRFSETRRPHPLSREGSPAEGIALEREKLLDMRDRASRIIDTTALTVHELRQELLQWFGSRGAQGTFSVSLMSFGYKYGTPNDADVVFDARFLANPYFVTDLRNLDGHDERVAAFVLDNDAARGFIERVLGLLDFTLPLHQREGRAYLTVAVGCTGGRHRSVALVDRLGYLLKERGYSVQLRQRDLGR